MASCFETFSVDQIEMKQSFKQIPRKRRTLACRFLLVGLKLFSC